MSAYFGIGANECCHRVEQGREDAKGEIVVCISNSYLLSGGEGRSSELCHRHSLFRRDVQFSSCHVTGSH
jgi:hypothetical protein